MRWTSRIPLGLAIAFIVVAPTILGSFTITLMNYIGIYAFAVLGLVLLTGVGGLTSFGQAAFVGIGAYATAWYTAVQGGSPWIGLLLALLLTGLVATVLGAATLRLGGHFLPLSTIAWGVAIFFLFGNIDAIGRYSGLSGIPAITIGPISRCTASFGDCSVSSCCCAGTCSTRERAVRSAACAAASPWWKASRSIPLGCALPFLFWPERSQVYPAGFMRICNAT
jgi:ABC-type branched-subunit amino acid transport system permease subunit